MKKTTIILLAAAMLGTATFTTAATNDPVHTDSPEAAMAVRAFDIAADRAIDEGYLTTEQAQTIKRSRIIQHTIDAFIASGYNPATAIDRAAQVAVEQGWFKNKQAAKQYLRRQLESARRSQTLADRIYRMMGL